MDSKIVSFIFFLLFPLNLLAAEFQGSFKQGSFILGKTSQNSKVYIDNITHNYISEIQNTRLNKRFIYTLIGKVENNDDYDSDKFSAWEECQFNSCRNFKNLFFENKDNLIKKIDFFTNN